MIALRKAIVRAQKNPFLRVLVFVLLAVLAVFVVIHASHDQLFEAGAAACIGLVLLVIWLFRVPHPLAFVTAEVPQMRGPPRVQLSRPTRPPATLSISLRL